MTIYVNPEMISIGRNARGYRQKDLAEKTGLSQSAISKYESGELKVGIQELQLLAEALEYPFRFFVLPEKQLAYGGTGVFHRHRRTKISANELEQFHAKLNILRIQLKRLLHYAHMEPEYGIPMCSLEDFGGDPAAVARQVRQDWKIPPGPIPNIVEVLEAAGIIIVMTTIEVGDISAVSQYVPQSGIGPLIYLNSEKPVDHQRFSLAHELGHIVMHHVLTEAPEDEANAFASEFLMPESDIGSSLFSVKLPMLFRLKPYWRVSVAALIQRAFSLGKITTTQRAELHRGLNNQMVKRQEHYPLSPEEPILLSEIFRVCAEEHGFSLQEMAEIMLMKTEELKWIYGGMDEFRDEPNTEATYVHSLTHFLASLSEADRERVAEIMSRSSGRLVTK